MVSFRSALIEFLHYKLKLHVVHGGVAAPQQLQEVQEKVSLARNPQRPVVGVAVLLDREAEEVSEERMAEIVSFQLELLLLFDSYTHPYVPFIRLQFVVAGRGEALRPTEEQLLH